MKKNIFFIGIVMVIQLCCIDVEPLAIFVNSYGKVGTYNFSDSLSEVPQKDWRYISSESSGKSDMLYIQAPDSAAFQNKLLIFFYGTGYNLYYSAQIGNLFRSIGFTMLSADYYGFGRTATSIKPSEELCYKGADETIHYAIDSMKYKTENIVLCGFSLGTGVVIEMATRYNVGGVLLFAPFLNIDTEVKTVSGGYDIPGDWFSKSEFNNEAKISKILAPLCMFVGEKDCLVDPRNMEELYELANEPKISYVLSDEDHPDFPSDSFNKWKDLVISFFKGTMKRQDSL